MGIELYPDKSMPLSYSAGFRSQQDGPTEARTY
jgi:hypothetical protein